MPRAAAGLAGAGATPGRALAAAGRCAFTNYLGTSLIMSALFCGWGAGLGWGNAHAVPRGSCRCS
jgi:uncharacterized protein